MEEATSHIAGFHVDPLSKLNWSLEMMVFLGRGKLESTEKNCKGKARANNMLNPHDSGLESNLGRIHTTLTLLCQCCTA